MEEIIRLKDIVRILKKRLLLIIGILIFGTGIAVGINYYLLPEIYQAQTQILVNQKIIDEETHTFSQSETDLQLIDTYNVIMKSPHILNKVIDKLKLDTTSEEISSQITVSNEENSKVVNIKVENTNSKQAVALANKIAEVFKEEIPNLMNVDNITILSEANDRAASNPVKPNKIINIGIASGASLLIGIGLSFLVEVLDTTIKNENDIEEISTIPLIGYVSPIVIEKRRKSKQIRFKEG